ncbi:unnamed protein product, partial [Discosporangium mesarthrocarpum]
LAGVAVGVVIGRRSANLRQTPAQSPGAVIDVTNERKKEKMQLFQSEGWEGGRPCSDWGPFRVLGKDMVDFIANYYEQIESFPVRAQVQPGYLQTMLPSEVAISEKAEKWNEIMADVEDMVMPGITHWQHPRFFSYYPANSSPPAILGDLLANMFNVIGFSWEASPAATELETLVMDMLAKAMGLPSAFLSSGKGGGVIQGSASESTLVALLAARTKALRHLQKERPGVSDQELYAKMTLYMSDQTHFSARKAAKISGLEQGLRTVPTSPDEDHALSVGDLAAVMQKDRQQGLTPIFVCASVGTTNTCAVDPVRALGELCCRWGFFAGQGEEEKGKTKGFVPWLHVDAAYAGAAAICPENRWLLDGLEYADSFIFNLHKW